MAGRCAGAARCLVIVLLCGAPIAGAQEEAARAKAAYREALALEGRGDDAAALAMLWQAAGWAPRDADVQNRLGEALLRVGALDAAIEAFRRATTDRPDFPKAANNLVLTLVQAGRGIEALRDAHALLAAAPNDPQRAFTLGLALADQDLEGAIATFRRVIALSPRHVLARYNLALALQRADRVREAVDELDRALRIEPRPEVWYTLGVIDWHRGETERAVTALRAAIEASPSYADAYYTLGAVLRDRRDYAGAATALRRALALRPDLPGAYVTLARVLQLTGDEGAARRALEDGERLRRRAAREHEALVWTALGAGKFDAGNFTGALDDFRRAAAAFDSYAPAHYQLGRTLQRLGETDAARAAFERAKQLNPNLVPPPYND